MNHDEENPVQRRTQVEALRQFDQQLARELDERARAERESVEKILDAVFEDQALVVGKVEARDGAPDADRSARLAARG